MKTTIELLNELRVRFNLPSDYALQPILKIKKQTISRYRNHGGAFDDDIAVRVAELLGYDSGYILVCMAAERSKTVKARSAWREAAEALAPAALVVLVAIGVTAPLFEVDFILPASAESVNSVYYVKSLALAALALFVIYALFHKHTSPDNPPQKK